MSHSPPSPQNSKHRVSVEPLSCHNQRFPAPAGPRRVPAPSPQPSRGQTCAKPPLQGNETKAMARCTNAANKAPGQGRDGMSQDRGLPRAADVPAPTSRRVSCLPGSPRVMLAYRDTAIRRAQAHGSCSTANPLLTLIGGGGWDQHKPPAAHPSPLMPARAAGFGL